MAVNLGKHCTSAVHRLVDRLTGDTCRTVEDPADTDGRGIELLQTDRSYPYQSELVDDATVLCHLDK